MASSSGSAPSSAQSQRKRSTLDVLLKKLHSTADHSRESSPDHANQKNARSGSSRRKPAIIRKVVESEETADSEDEAALSPAIEYNDHGNGSCSPLPGPSQEDGEADGDDEEMDGFTTDEHGNRLLADGTMVVQPEAVVEKRPAFKGPEFKTRKRHPSDLDMLMCSACNKQINPNLPGAARRHPVLKVLICKKCYNWYTSDEIDQDSDGMDEQCRWCGDGGNLLCCDFCHNAFCKACIKRNLGRAELSSITESGEEEKWHCYVCNSKPLNKLVVECNRILENIEEAKRRRKEVREKREVEPSGSLDQVTLAKMNGKGKGKTSTPKSSSAVRFAKNLPHGILPPGINYSPIPGGKGGIMGRVPLRKPGPVPRQMIPTDFTEFEINPNNVAPVLDRLVAATQSMTMLLSSLSDDLKVSRNSSIQQTARYQIQVEVSKKLKRAMVAYKKLFRDIENYAWGTHSVKSVPSPAARGMPQGRVPPVGPTIQRSQQPTRAITQKGHLSTQRNHPRNSAVDHHRPKPGLHLARNSHSNPPVKKEEYITLISSDEDEPTEKAPRSPKETINKKDVKDEAPVTKKDENKISDNKSQNDSEAKASPVKEELESTAVDSSVVSQNDIPSTEKELSAQETSVSSPVKTETENPTDITESKSDGADAGEDEMEVDQQSESEKPDKGQESSESKGDVSGQENLCGVVSSEQVEVNGHGKEGPGAEVLTNGDIDHMEEDDEDLDATGQFIQLDGPRIDQPVERASSPDAKPESPCPDLPSADKDIEDFDQGDFVKVYKAALETEMACESQDSQAEEEEEDVEAPPSPPDHSDTDSDLEDAVKTKAPPKKSKAKKGKSSKGTARSKSPEKDEDLSDKDGTKPKRASSKRTHADIEAQRLLHLELLEDSPDSNSSQKDTSDSDSESDQKKEKGSSSGSEYNPSAELKGRRKEKLTRTEEAKKKSLSKFAELRKKREKLKEKEMSEEKAKKKKTKKGRHEDSSDEDEMPSKKSSKRNRKNKGRDSSSDRERKSEKVRAKKNLKNTSDEESDDEKVDKKRSKDARKKTKEGHKGKVSSTDKQAESNEEESSSKDFQPTKKKKKAGEKKEKVDDSGSGSGSEKEAKKRSKKKEDTRKGPHRRLFKDADSDSDMENRKKEKGKEETRGKKTKKEKHESDSSNYDSDLEDEIDKLTSIPKGNSKRQPKKDNSRKKEKEPKESIKEEKKKGQSPSKSSRSGKRRGQNGVDINELGSGSSAEDEEEEEESAPAETKSDDEEDQEAMERLKVIQSKTEVEEANAKARKALLGSDDSDTEVGDSDGSDAGEKSVKNKKEKKVGEKGKEDDASSESDVTPSRKKKKAKMTQLLAAKLSESDSDSDMKTKKRSKKARESDAEYSGKEDAEDDDEDDNLMLEDLESTDLSDSSEKKTKKGKKKDSDDSESDSGRKSKKSNKKKGKGKKRKRRRIKNMSSSEANSSDANSDSDAPKKKKKRKKKGEDDTSEDDEDDDDENTPGKRRKNIKRIIKDKKLSQQTQDAGKAEEERRQRIAERQKLVEDVNKEYNQVTIDDETSPTKCPKTTKLVLESTEEDRKPIIQVHKELITKLKPHQVEAVKFLWDCLVESLDRLEEESGAGAILAHCMGLGKTLSVITFVYTLLSNYKKTKQRTCLVVCPLNTVLNWQNEWSKWQPADKELDVYELSSIKDNFGRCDLLRHWQNTGGIMIMGYEMYRNLSQNKRVRNKKQKKAFTETLLDPGPDIVVCDEGHILKNEKTSTSIAMNQVRTQRRIVLTGTPLQNNLSEYHCMVNFVKPNLLGSRKEFSNRFINPIMNGQCSDSSKQDEKLMKKRAHILHEKLAGCVQRRDYSALTKFLPPKYEYIISIRLSPVQCDLYQQYLISVGRAGVLEKGDVRGASVFSDYQLLMRIWTHPWILKLHEVREQNKRVYDSEDSFIDDEDDDEMDSFIDDDSGSDHSDASDPAWSNKRKTRKERAAEKEKKAESPKPGTSSGKKSDSDVEIVKEWKTRSRGGEGKSDSEKEEEKDTRVSMEWWADHLSENDQFNLELSGKMTILAEILKMSEAIGDKVLVFSQSLLSLDLIEDYLDHWDKAVKPDNPEDQVAGLKGWTHGVDYFRMDGSTSGQTRQKWSDIFNDKENTTARLFLISTKAGSLGTNMVGANRVIVFDASWNPTHDVQSIFRVYRFGQDKPVYIYRFVAQGTMEEKIYARQVAKQSLASRVVDEHQIERHFTADTLQELYCFTPDRLDDPDRKETPMPALPKDRMLAELLVNQKNWIVGYHEHDSLLENQIDAELTEEERKVAWEEYEAEKKGLIQRVAMPNYSMYQQQQQQPYQQMAQHYQQYAQMNMGQQMAPPSNSVFPHLTEVARAIRTANPNISMPELQQRLEHYMRLQMASQQQQMYRQQQQQQQQMHQLNRLQQGDERRFPQLQNVLLSQDRNRSQPRQYGGVTITEISDD